MSTPEQAPDGITLLMEDHRTVERLYAQFQQAGPHDSARRSELVHQIVRELSVHAIAEEEYLYPATAEAFPGGEDLAHHSVEEHQQIKEVLNDIDSTPADDPSLDGKLRTLMDEVNHHVEEEEGELFPKLRAALGQERIEELGRRLATAKAIAPTRPHPGVPNSPVVEKLTGPAVAAVDRVRDLGRNFPGES